LERPRCRHIRSIPQLGTSSPKSAWEAEEAEEEEEEEDQVAQ
jgi:hypothetical protein